MYNSEQKERYIKEKRDSTIIGNNFLERQFNNIADYEKELNKDLSNFTTPEIIEYYKILGTRSLESLTVINSQYSMYTQWCLQQNQVLDSQNHYLEMNIDTLFSCLNQSAIDKSVVNREELLSMIHQLPNYRDQFIFLFLFEIGKGKDFSRLTNCRITDFDINNQTVNIEGKQMQVSKELVYLAQQTDKQDTYYSITQKEIKSFKFIDNGYIIKDIPPTKRGSDFRKGRRIYTCIIRNLDYLGIKKWHTANSIIHSGIIHMIHQRSKELNITPENYIRHYNKEITERYGVTIVVSTFLKKYQNYL